MHRIPFGNTPLSRCAYYRQVCDLPADVHPPHLGRIIMHAGVAWALIMPAVLGQEVKAHMQGYGTGLGPILSHPRSGRWTYIVRPDLPDEVSLFVEMFRLNVSIVRAGGTIALPSPADRCMRFRVWVHRPICSFRPSGRVVVDAIRACAARSESRGMSPDSRERRPRR